MKIPQAALWTVMLLGHAVVSNLWSAETVHAVKLTGVDDKPLLVFIGETTESWLPILDGKLPQGIYRYELRPGSKSGEIHTLRLPFPSDEQGDLKIFVVEDTNVNGMPDVAKTDSPSEAWVGLPTGPLSDSVTDFLRYEQGVPYHYLPNPLTLDFTKRVTFQLRMQGVETV